jgi:hypothetical protein
MPNVALVFASGVSHPYLPDFFSAFRVDAVLRQQLKWRAATGHARRGLAYRDQ